MTRPRVTVLLLGILASQLIHAGGPPGGKSGGRTENAQGIVTMLTQDVSVDIGLFSDQWLLGDPDSNLRYYSTQLNGQTDPDDSGSVLAGGSCVSVVTPADDGVDQGRLTFFVPFATAECDPSLLRQIMVLGAGYDLNVDAAVTNPELIDARLRCEDVFPKNSPVPGGSTTTSCDLQVRLYDDAGEHEVMWVIQWLSVNVTHSELDLRRLDTISNADIYQYVPSERRNGKRDLILRESKWLPFRIDIRRMRGI